MIASLRGSIGGRTEGSIIVDVQGVGYLVHVSARTLGSIGKVGEDILLMIVTQVREDAITLYGFRDADERETFRLLISVQGVGPKIALAVLSVMDSPDVLAAIVAGDSKRLCAADGVGPKVASRLVNECRDRAATLGIVSRSTGPCISSKDHEVRSALLNLGYGRAEVEHLLAEAGRLTEAPDDIAGRIQACLRLAARKAA